MEGISTKSSDKCFWKKAWEVFNENDTHKLFEKFDLIYPQIQILPLERKAFITSKKRKTRN